MTLKRMLALCGVLVILSLAMGMMPAEVSAQAPTNQSVRDSMAGVEKDEDKGAGGPSKPQMALGIGSFIVMVIVVKWL